MEFLRVMAVAVPASAGVIGVWAAVCRFVWRHGKRLEEL